MRPVTGVLLSIIAALSLVLSGWLPISATVTASPVPAGPGAAAASPAAPQSVAGAAKDAAAPGAVKSDTQSPSSPSEGAIQRARREVRMLDDLYKTTVVLITTHYVEDEDSLSAASAARALFQAMKEKGWHDVRLVDATGQPYLDENLPKPGFEQRAVEQLLAGRPGYDEVVTENGSSWLLSATPVPVVMDKCIICHENYRNVEKNHPIGALSYRVPILE